MSVACSSGLESRYIARNLVERGKDAILEADGLKMKNRPEAAQTKIAGEIAEYTDFDLDAALRKPGP